MTDQLFKGRHRSAMMSVRTILAKKASSKPTIMQNLSLNFSPNRPSSIRFAEPGMTNFTEGLGTAQTDISEMRCLRILPYKLQIAVFAAVLTRIAFLIIGLG